MIFCSDIEERLNISLEKFNMSADFDVFYSGERFLQNFEAKGANVYDLIFLDIHLEGISGITVGEEIRKKDSTFFDNIVFISSDVSKAFEAINIEPLGFLKKPIDSEKFDDIVHKFVNRYNSQRKVFTYKFNKVSSRLLVKEIIYFESSDKKITFHTINNEKGQFYDTLDNVEKTLKNSRFIRISKSYLVNIHHVTSVTRNAVNIDNRLSLKIGRKARDKVAKQFSDFILKGW